MRRLIGTSLILFLMTLAYVGYGFNTLPELRKNAKPAYSELMVQYRLRADVAFQLAKVLKNDFPQLSQDVVSSRGRTLSSQPNLDKFDSKKNNRFQSYQNFLSRDVNQLIQAVQNSPKLKGNTQVQNMIELNQRINQKIVLAKRKYLSFAIDFNNKIHKFPHSIYNKWKHRFDLLPVWGEAASSGGK